MSQKREIAIYNDSSSFRKPLNLLLSSNDNESYWKLMSSLSESFRYDSLHLRIEFLKDFENVEPRILCCLSGLVNQFVTTNKKVIVEIYSHTTAGKHLLDCQFLEIWKSDRVNARHWVSRRNDILNLWRIEPYRETAYSFFLKGFFVNNERTSDLDMAGFINAVTEAVLNVSQHSRSNGNAFVYTDLSEDKEKCRFAVYDAGIGIPASIQNRTMYGGLSDIDALLLALKPKITSRSVINNQGMGLSNIRDVVESAAGMLRIISKSALFSLIANEGEEHIQLTNSHHGTLLEVSVPLKNFYRIPDGYDDVIDFF